MLKKSLAMLIATSMVFLLAACGGDSTVDTSGVIDTGV